MDLLVDKLKDTCLNDNSPLKLRHGRTVKRLPNAITPSVSNDSPASPPSSPLSVAEPNNLNMLQTFYEDYSESSEDDEMKK
ncbi:unnamed protein product [Brachionus calyciflorus]|uniref:Uncharacterized protein n=1 Tax=Brachionus calyciflorus TaxID=104777 RepID=A0A814HCY1_9BILA|nr:unnamed protein product [Brachionus calyciflorus]